ncbi:hypothetical protein SAMN02746000_01483 [Paracoccus sp. J56]|nr:hypothetical protein SAMN02746000_01483 [Paracoccus sp. J56]
MPGCKRTLARSGRRIANLGFSIVSQILALQSSERFTLEWASEYLAMKRPEIVEVQQRGGAGDKGRNVLAWHDPNTVPVRKWTLYQCKHYASAPGTSTAATEIGKVLFYSHRGDYTFPEEYHFVTYKGVTSPFQDLLDKPEDLRKFIIDNWDEHCQSKIRKRPLPRRAAERGSLLQPP